MLNGSYTVGARLYAVRNGAVLKSLLAEDLKITMSENAEIKTAFSCFIRKDADIDLLNDRLRPYQVVDGIEYPVGEFIVTTAEEATENGYSGWNIEAYDQCLLLRQRTARARPSFAAGLKYTDVVQSLLAECGVTRVIVEPSNLMLTAIREDWEIGDDYLTIANALLAEINYESLWFDFEGFARLRKIRRATAANITQTYRADEHSVLHDGIAKSQDSYTAYNVFTVVVSAADGDMIATAVNDSPLSPISTVRHGEICAPVEYLDDIASQEELQTYADNLMADAMLSNETIQFKTAPIPTHQVGEVVALPDGIYRETGWTLKLGYDGEYAHEGKRSMLL